jgi:NADH dehydrogenase [ubiquinone] 1 alpha subcomplex assembly factor 7
MALALGHPEHGYYRKQDPLGRSGDFITAPEISQVFGELIGLWAAIAWQQAGSPAFVQLIELGPGRGTLMADFLRAAKSVPGFVEALDIHLVETSPALRQCQKQTLGGNRVQWHAELANIPAGPALIIANEFFDALPVDQYIRTADGWCHRCIGMEEGGETLCFIPGDPATLPEAVSDIATGALQGSILEYSPASADHASQMASRMAEDGIAALIIDYGHARSGAGETLQAVRGHSRHDVLSNIGNADLTTHVDFETLSRAAANAGAAVYGPLPQGAFLAALGIEARTEVLAGGAKDDQAGLLHSGCRRLIAADGMGTLFKVLALTGKNPGLPAAFEGMIGNIING